MNACDKCEKASRDDMNDLLINDNWKIELCQECFVEMFEWHPNLKDREEDEEIIEDSWCQKTKEQKINRCVTALDDIKRCEREVRNILNRIGTE